jgi:hypothetical protein
MQRDDACGEEENTELAALGRAGQLSGLVYGSRPSPGHVPGTHARLGLGSSRCPFLSIPFFHSWSWVRTLFVSVSFSLSVTLSGIDRLMTDRIVLDWTRLL